MAKNNTIKWNVLFIDEGQLIKYSNDKNSSLSHSRPSLTHDISALHDDRYSLSLHFTGKLKANFSNSFFNLVFQKDLIPAIEVHFGIMLTIEVSNINFFFIRGHIFIIGDHGIMRNDIRKRVN